MSDFVDDEAEESEEEHELNPREKKRAKKARAMEDSDEEEEDDEARYREELKDFVDDNLVESDAEDSDDGGATKKRKNSDDEDFDDRLEDDDYDLLEENLGISVKRKRFKRLRRMEDRESDEEIEQQPGHERDAIANELFDPASGDDDEMRSVRSHRQESEIFHEEGSEGDESDADDFIVDNDGRPIAEKRRKKRPVFSDAALQQAQDIFGIDFDYDEIGKYNEDGEEEEEDEEDNYANDEGLGEKSRASKKLPKKNANKKTIFDIYEPIELKRGHFTDRDNEIRNADVPERMQTRSVPVTPVPEGSNELDLESEWIYNQAFCRPTISIQDAHLSDEAKERACKGPQTIPKIKKALDFMRNQNFEVPFISFYRKEYVLPELNINDLWKVYKYDAKWCELRERKENLLSLFTKMREYQLDEVMKNPDAPLPESVRIVKEDDLDRLKSVETSEELNDVYHHFMLYYGNEVPKMQYASREREKFSIREEKLRRRQQQIADALAIGEDPPVDEDEDLEIIEAEIDDNLKQAVKTGSYALCQKAGLDEFAKKFGLTPEQFAENLRDNYQRHDVEQDPTEPFLTALDFRSKQFDDPDEILKAVQLMVAIQLAREPLVRKCVREMYMERAKISIRPTKKGIKEIDENHPIYAMKYLKEKPVKELVGDQFLKISIAEQDKLVEISFSDVFEGNTSDNYVEEMKQLYHRDEFSKNVQDWNALRVGAAEIALAKMVIPDMKKELRKNLLAESKEFVLRASCRKMYNWIKVAPYQVNFEEETPVMAEDDWDAPEQTRPKEKEKTKDPEWDTSKGIRVMGIAYVPDFSQAAFACLISPDGECTDYLKIPHLLKRKTSQRPDDKSMKEEAMKSIESFIISKKPHAIVIGGESREATMLIEDLQECVTTLTNEEQFPEIKIEICDNELAKIYANSSRGVEEFRDYPILLRQAISLARRLQDPLVEFSQLCTSDDEILCLKYHPYQDEISKEDLLENLQLEFVNRVNEVGVDLNKAVSGGYSGNLVQFVCGLGARKAQALIKMLKQTNQRIENRTQLVTICHMGPKIFINCAGFIKIDTGSLGDSTEAYVEVLDGSRVHPETYEWARKMAVDALEYDDEEANPAGALEEIVEAPERLKDLDLDAFAEELERQGFGDKCTTLYDIRAELNCRYKDLRAPYEAPTPEKLFDMLTKETPESFYIGKLILANVTGLNYRKPEGEQLDQANPVRNDDTGLWQCPFCMKNDFPELSEVWNHFDAGTCRGRAIGIRLRLDNGISGYIHLRNLSDKHVNNPEERVRPGQAIHCRIIKIEVDRFGVECTSKTSDLTDKNHEMRPQRDTFYDFIAEEHDVKVEEDAKKLKQQRAYIKRVIVHPAFHNISYSEAAKLMESMKQGETIVRPSSKGEAHLTVTWKVTDDILHHIDVREEGKKFGFSLGKKLWIGTEEFEDLDEIIARHVNPMAAYASELLECHYYTPNIDGVEAKAEQVLNERKRNKPSSIPCIISPSKTYPAKFMLSYLPRERCMHEYVSVSPDGVRFRGQTFPIIGKMFSWFKKHFREIPPRVATPKTPGYATPGANQDASDDFSLGGDDMSYSGGYGGEQSHPNTPYTPSGKTPFLTPYQTPFDTPNQTQTPKYGQDSTGKFLAPSGPPGTGVHYKTTQSHKTSTAGPNFCADPEIRKSSGSWKLSEDGTFKFTSDDDSSNSSQGRGRGDSRGRGNFRGRGDFKGRGNSRGGRGDFRGGRGGRGNSRGDRGTSRNSYNSYSGNSFTSDSNKTTNSTSAGNNTPLWDENESWDSPGITSTRNPSSMAKAPSNSISSTNATMGNRTPLWDEGETWDSPGQASLPDDSRNNSAASNASIIASSGPQWDTEESWDDPDPTPSRNTQNSTQVSSQPFRGAPRNNSTPSSSRPQKSFRGGANNNSTPSSFRAQKSFRGGANNNFTPSRTPANTNSGPQWDTEENWDDDEPQPPKSGPTAAQSQEFFRGAPSNNSAKSNAEKIVNSGPQWDADESWDDPEPTLPQNAKPSVNVKPQQSFAPRNNSASLSSSIIESSGPQWDTEESWDDDESTPAKTVKPPFCPPEVRPSSGNSQYNSAPSSFSSRQYSRGGYNSGQSRPPARQFSRGGQQCNSARSNAPIIGNRGNNFGRSNPPIVGNSGNNSAALSASKITNSGPQWDTEENWDDDEPTPQKTTQTIVPPYQSSTAASQFKSPNLQTRQAPPGNSQFSAPSSSAPIIATSGPQWGDDESWDDDDSSAPKTAKPIVPPSQPSYNAPEFKSPNLPSRQPNRGSLQYNSPNLQNRQAPPGNSQFNAPSRSAPIIATSGPQWDDDESWDDDDSSTPKTANPIAPPSQPSYNAPEFKSPNLPSRQPNRGNLQYNSSNLQNRQAPPGNSQFSAPLSSAPIIATSGPQWDDDESWDDDDSSAPKTAKPIVPPSQPSYNAPEFKSSNLQSHQPNRESSQYNPSNLQSRHFDRGTSQYNSPNLQSRQPTRGTSQYNSPNPQSRNFTPAVLEYNSPNAPSISGSMWEGDENWDDDDNVPATSKAAQTTQLAPPSQPGPSAPIILNSSGPNWNTDESWDDDQPEKTTVKNLPPPMSAPPPRQFQRNEPTTQNSYRQHRQNSGGAMQNSYRQHRENNGGVMQNSYRQHRENNGGATTQNSYRQNRENNGGTAPQNSYRQHRENKERAAMRTPYQRPPRNEGATGRAPYQQPPPNGPPPAQSPADIPQSNSNSDSSDAPINMKNLFGDSESWD